jgi:hypothetical protein
MEPTLAAARGERPDPDLENYLAQVRDKIRSNWFLLCGRNPTSWACGH